MPEFLITSPEGKQYRVTGPEGATREQALQMLQGQLGESAQSGQSTPTSSGLPAFIRDVPKEVGNAFNESLSNVTDLWPDDKSKPPSIFAIPKAIGGALGMPLSLLTGPARSVIGHPMADLTQAAGEAIAGKNNPANPTNEQLYEDWKPGVDKALMGLGARAPVAAPVPRTVATPSVAEIRAASRAGYQSPEVTAVELHPNAVTSLARRIETDLLTEGFRPATNNATGTFAEVRNMRPPPGVTSVRVADIDAARRALGRYAKQVDVIGQPTTEAAAAQRAIDHINDFLPHINRLAPADIIAGDPARASQVLQGARQDWASYKRASTVDTLEENAARQAASTYGGGNVNNAMRQAFRPFVKNNNAKLPGWSQPSLDQFNRVVSGGSAVSPGNIARQVGRYAPSGPVGLGLHLAAGAATGGASIPFAVAAAAAKQLGIAATRANVNRLRTTLLQESNLYQQRLAASGYSPAPVIGMGARALPYTQPGLIATGLMPRAPALGIPGQSNEQLQY